MESSKVHKVMSLQETVGLVKDGDVVAIQGVGTQMVPMAVVRELIRHRLKNLTIITLVGGIGVDLLVGAGCVRKVIAPIVYFEQHGVPPNYRRAVEAGEIEVEEYSENTLLCRLSAAANGLPFLPTQGSLGTDLLKIHPETTKVFKCPFTGERLVACSALVPDIALVHVHKADRIGNCQVEPMAIWSDITVMARAAKQVIATAERIVDASEIRRAPEKTLIPYFIVDAVAEVEYGAHPCSMYPHYQYDRNFLERYVHMTKTNEGIKEFLDKYVFGPRSHAEYLEKVGKAKMMKRIKY